MATIFHLALASEWAQAQESGAYTTSTRGRTLAEEGFIHASRADQWTAVRDRFYADVTEPLVLLHIDTDLLDVPVLEEPPAPGVEETFPHIYGRLPVTAVVKAIPLGEQRAAATGPAASVATSPTSATTPVTPGESFSRVYLREMLHNVVLLCLVIAVGLLGAVAGHTVVEDGGLGIGGLTGMTIGVVVARILFRRRHAAR